MSGTDVLEQARASFAREAWAEAFDRLTTADDESPLEPADLERLATAAYLLGRDEESSDGWTRAHRAHLDRDEAEAAARCAFWLGLQLLHVGLRARGGGWIARARRLLDDGELDCATRGLLLIPIGLRRLGEGDADGAHRAFSEAAEVGERYGDPDVIALGRLGRGQALIRMGEREPGVALLDEAMATVEAGGLSPVVVGTIYCAVIETCGEIFDVRRATEWTAALSDWCDAHPDLVPFRGQCLVRRAELMELRGDWEEAHAEARRACELLTRPPGEPAAGEAFYRLAELHRLRGAFDEAEEAYREAARHGREPEPGLALLRKTRGRIRDAGAAARRMLDEAAGGPGRARVLSACVEILLAADDVAAARRAADELSTIAAGLDIDAPALDARAAAATGAVRLAEGDGRAALDELRTAWSTWEALEAPYEAARVRVLVGRACRELGDEDTATMELEAARFAFERLGAGPDAERVEALLTPESDDDHGLSPRELQVLRLVAAGKTNRAIGDELSISERTVERHVSHIFQKLGVSSRAAATAWAYEHDLV